VKTGDASIFTVKFSQEIISIVFVVILPGMLSVKFVHFSIIIFVHVCLKVSLEFSQDCKKSKSRGPTPDISAFTPFRNFFCNISSDNTVFLKFANCFYNLASL